VYVVVVVINLFLSSDCLSCKRECMGGYLLPQQDLRRNEPVLPHHRLIFLCIVALSASEGHTGKDQ
jgi:hypothetical protein